MKILITGANGFLGRNLRAHLSTITDVSVSHYTRDNDISRLSHLLSNADFVFHFAGVNRADTEADFAAGNRDLTEALCSELVKSARKIPVVFSSSIQAEECSVYGKSKKAAERAMFKLRDIHNFPVYVFQLPNIFGKWSRPNYNSVIATFCHNVSRGLTIQVNDPEHTLQLIYVDDLMDLFMGLVKGASIACDVNGYSLLPDPYYATVGDIAKTIMDFESSGSQRITERVGTGLTRALYATYVSFFPPERFSYSLTRHSDNRGIFVEMLKTRDSGQFSFFTASPGVTRGGHYHHSKTEKFLVISGNARFRFLHIDTGQSYEKIISNETSEVIETIPGWSHDITNIGETELICMIWASEIFDSSRPDTFPYPLVITTEN